jgi:prepilin signal peptidase PulO-like enzyme (type II secretory pathway)
MSETREASATATDGTRAAALVTLFVAIAAIAVGYVAAFRRAGTPPWAPWCLAIGVPVALGAIMVLGAARGRRGVGRLKIPFAFVVVTLAIGFGAALALPATEGPLSRLWLGLPLRAAIVIYGVGLLPIFVLPIAYALTFETQTLSAEDVERVRALARNSNKGGTDAVSNE